MLDKTTPVAGREWYCGRWRTPEQIERYRSRMRAYLHRRRNTEPEFREKDRQRAAAARLKAGATPRVVTQERRRAVRASRELAKAERRAALTKQREAVRDAQARAQRAPIKVRDAWKAAKPNSIIRRKYPTMADLDASARRGDFEAWR